MGDKSYLITGTEYKDRHEMRGKGLRWDRELKGWRGSISPETASNLKKRYSVKER